MKFKKESGYSRVFNAKTVLFLVAVILMMVLVSGTAMAVHTSNATVIPDLVAGGENDLLFTVHVCNEIGPDSVSEFRIYFHDDFDDYDCQAVSGWNGPTLQVIEGLFFCQYTTNTTSDRIQPGFCEDFNFKADVPIDECCREFRFETRDPSQYYTPLEDDICIDTTPPRTFKWYVGAQYPDPIINVTPNPYWITTSTEVWLGATDCPGGCDRESGPHDSTVVATYYRDIYLEDDAKWHYCESDCASWDPTEPSNLLDPTGEGWSLWVEDTPFYKSPESCHIIQYYSVDGVGNVEPIKHQCVYVDDTPPDVHKEHGTPIEPGSGFDSVTPATNIEFWCDDPEPHPVEGEELCFKVWYDLAPDDGYLTDDYCTNYAGEGAAMENEWCCLSATPSNHFIFNFNTDEDSEHSIEYFCRDEFDQESIKHTQWYHVDTMPPTITKTMLGDDHLGYRDAVLEPLACPPDPDYNDECFVRDNGVNGVRIDVTDGDNECASGIETCNYELWWETDLDKCINEFSGTHLYNFDTGKCFVEGGEFGIEGKDILFQEDSTHELYIYCEDFMGNWDEDTETFYVDSTPPFVFKEYGDPSYVEPACWDSCVADCSNKPEELRTNCTRDCAHANCMWWLKTTTPVSLFAGDEKVGVDEIKYRVSPSLGNQFCENCANWMTMVRPDMGAWNIYGVPFTIPDESCHVIEYTAVDRLGNGEELDEIMWQCVYVEDTPPTVWKKIGAPNASSDDPNIYYISGQTPITMYCEDMGLHPVDAVSLWYRYRFSEDCVNWGPWVPSVPENCSGEFRDGWCDPPGCGMISKTIYFPEDSCHELEYYCEDALGNIGETQKEIDIVDSVPPVIEKTIIGPYIECPEKEEINGNGLTQLSEQIMPMPSDCFLIDGVTNISVMVTDPDPHPVGQITCEWGYWWNDAYYGPYLEDAFPFLITGLEESEHLLEITCWDGLGNQVDDTELFIVDKTPPETLKMYGQPRYPVDVMTDELCYKDVDNSWNCYTSLPTALEDIGYTELPEGALTYKASGPVLEIIVELTGLKPETEYQLTLNGRDGNDGNAELGNNCANPNAPKEGYDFAWECGTWPGGTGDEGFWNFDMTATTDAQGDFEQTYFLEMPDGHYGVGPAHMFGFGFIVKEAADVPGGSNYPPILMEYHGLDWTIEPYTYPLWITSETPIYLSAHDPDPHPSGVNKTQYRVSGALADNFCNNCENWMSMLRPDMGDWNTYTGPFSIPDDSCHVIEYRSIDNVEKTEDIKWQCVFVDNQPPTPSKEVGEPKTPWDGLDANFYDLDEFCETPDNCWKVTQLTPIHLECNDPDPHPVDHETVCFNVELDAVDETERYCEYYSGIMEDDGYCCLPYELDNFYFKEETEHNLKYYCVDALGNGNKEAVDDEKFKVEGTRFDIPLFKKWNLISVPFVLMDDDPEVVFEDIAEDIISVWAYDPGLEMCGLDWCVWTPGEGPDNLRIWPGWGYWVLVNTTIEEEPLWLVLGGSLFNHGPVAPPSRDLQPGWNLIGYYGTSWELYDWMDFSFECGDAFIFPDRYVYGDKVYCSLNSLVDTQEGYPKWSGVWSFLNCGDHQTTWLGLNACADQSVQQALDRMYAGRGYWIEIDVEETYAPSTNCIWNSDFQCRWTGGGLIP